MQWNRLAIFRFFQPSVANQIIQMELPINSSSDEIYWKLHKTGNYSLLNKGLPLSSSLVLRHIPVNDIYPLCGKEPETYQHLFRLCLLVQRIRASLSLRIRSSMNTSTPFPLWIKEFLLLFIDQDGLNGKKHLPNPGQTHKYPTSFLLVHLGRRKDNISQLILLIDGSWSPTDNNAGSAWVLSASPERGGAFYSKTNSTFQTEALALLHGLLWAHDLCFTDLLVYTDCSTLILRLQQRSTSIDSIWAIKDILRAGSLFNNCKILKVGRLQIQLAHNRATACRSSFMCFKSS
ncbi:Breast carcinoma-amplified sequence 4 [Bienertia sinuspersici]